MKSKPESVREPEKMKPCLSIDGEDYAGIEDLQINDEVKVIASGRVKAINADSYTGKEKFGARIELTKIEIVTI